MQRVLIFAGGLFFMSVIHLSNRSAWAGLHLEPYFGYGTGTFELESSLGTNESDVKGVLLGLRIGYARRGFFIGPDLWFQTGLDYKPSIRDVNVTGNSSTGGDATLGGVGLTAGYKLPIVPLRVYAGYGLFHAYSLEFSDGSDTDFEGNGGFKVGVGYKPGFLFIRLPLYINLEYAVLEFDEATGVGVIGGNAAEFPFITGTGNSIAQYNDAEVKTIFLTVSAPFHFFGN